MRQLLILNKYVNYIAILYISQLVNSSKMLETDNMETMIALIMDTISRQSRNGSLLTLNKISFSVLRHCSYRRHKTHFRPSSSPTIPLSGGHCTVGSAGMQDIRMHLRPQLQHLHHHCLHSAAWVKTIS